MKEIMIVEDSFINMAILEKFCKLYNFPYKIFINGNDAIKELQINIDKYGLILMDIYMPTIDGIECFQIIRQDKRFQNIPIIATTAMKNKQYLLDLGFNDYISKPYDFKYLMECIEKYMGLNNNEKDNN